MSNDTERRKISVRLNVAVDVELRFNEDGEGEIVSHELAPNQMITAREIVEALDGVNELWQLDRDGTP